jgi:ABC-type multidrug transport system permease subunit
VVLGFRFGGGPAQAVGAMLLVAAFGLTMCWPMAFIGITARTTESVNTWGFLIVLPLTFVSSAFVPPETMPGWLQTFAEWNPLTAVIDATRRLMHGLPLEDTLVRSVVWMIVIVLVFAPLAIARYRRRV